MNKRISLPAFQEFIADIATQGVVVSSKKKHHAAFIIIPSRTNARWWVIPTENRRLSVSGIDLFQPITLSAKLLKFLIKVVSKCGLLRILPFRRIALTGIPQASKCFSQETIKCSYFTGTTGPHRKTTIQFMSTEGLIIGYAKITRKKSVAKYMENESKTLESLVKLHFKTASFPKKLFYGNFNGSYTLVTDSIKTENSAVPVSLQKQHFMFLKELMNKTIVSLGPERIEDIEYKYLECKAKLTIPWQIRLEAMLAYLNILKSTNRFRCLIHGDFTPWNTFLEGSKLYVFDWEYSQVNMPLGHDLIHFRMSTTTHETSPKELYDLLLEDLRILLESNKHKIAIYSILCYLYNHTTFYALRDKDNSPFVDWHDEDKFANFIDYLIKHPELIESPLCLN